MKGIECAFVASLGQDVELRTSKAEKKFCTFSCVVTTGHDEDGKEIGQWLRVICFGDTAEKVAERAKKGDRIYVEGLLTLNTWDGADGETKHGLNVTAWRAERLSNIGRSKVKRPSHEPDEDVTEPVLSSFVKAPAKAKAKEHVRPFDDPLSF